MADQSLMPDEAADLLSARPDQFVSERNQLVKRLRDAGRSEEAAQVAGLRKPPRVVLAVNRAACELPLQARAAARASEKLVEAQARGSRDQFEQRQTELQEAVDALVARAAESSVDRTVAHRLVRAALSSEQGRRALAHGALTDVLEEAGFGALAGVRLDTGRRKAARAERPAPERRREAEAERRRVLEDQLAEARQAVRQAQRAEQQARSELETAQRHLDSIETALKRLRNTRP